MRDATYFIRPEQEWQRRYEALRASFVERLPAEAVAQRFGYTAGYVRLMRHLFRQGKIDLSEPPPEGKASRRRVSAKTRQRIRVLREQHLSGGEIAEVLHQAGLEIGIRTVERVLAEEGFPKLPRRLGLKAGLTVKGAEAPVRSEAVTVGQLEGAKYRSASAGAFLFAPFLAQFPIDAVVRSAGLPGTKPIPSLSYFLSFLALKLLGTERYAHAGDHAFDPGLGLLAGLNALPKCTALSTYSYGLDEVHIQGLQEAFVRRASKLGLYDGSLVNLDFHAIPHWGDESVLQTHWAGARGKAMKSALTLFAQDAGSKLMLYTAADIRREESDGQVTDFLSFWKKVSRGLVPTFVFDSRLTSYAKLSELNGAGVKFITLRRRGANLVAMAEKAEGFRRIHIPHDKRKYPNPEVHESTITLRGYDGFLRQIIVRGNGREKPAFLITNDFEQPAELAVGNYARRWRVENGIAEAVKFFHLNALSSPILVKVHFDVAMTMIADTLYSMLAHKLRGFEDCDAAKLYRLFVRTEGDVEVHGGTVHVTFPRKAHNPILRQVPWHNLPQDLPWLPGAKLALKFK